MSGHVMLSFNWVKRLDASQILTKGQSCDVQTSGSDIGTNKELNLARFEALKVFLSFSGFTIAVQTNARIRVCRVTLTTSLKRNITISNPFNTSSPPALHTLLT